MRGQESTTLLRAAPTASRRARRSRAIRSSEVSRPGRPCRSSSRSSGSSITFWGNSFSARPGTNTASNDIPRAPATGPTYTLPWRFPPGGTDSSVRRRARTSRTSLIEIGPTGPIGASSASRERTRAGSRNAREASAVKGSSHSPQVAVSGSAWSASSSGRAKSRSVARSSSCRCTLCALASSSAKAASVVRSCALSPSSLRSHRSRPTRRTSTSTPARA